MAKRDPNKTARNRRVADIKIQRRAIQPLVFDEMQTISDGMYTKEASLNAFIGSKTDDYIKLYDEIIQTPMEYKSKWLSGLKRCYTKALKSGSNPRHVVMYNLITGELPNFKKYVSLFLESSFLKHYEEHYKKKPKIDESEYWFGNNNDEFGLLVTPRFSNNQWENDKSEIRHFKKPYWTIAHVMETGLCYMDEAHERTFSNIEDYLQFFRDMVRRTKSKYQLEIADRYIEHIRASDDPLSIPLLIPELRYDHHKKKHQHRLDYLIINPWTLEKYGFEFSPWSAHGKLKGANRKMVEYDKDSRENFEKEMKKHKRYWRKYGVTYIIYTDEDLVLMDEIWSEMKNLLEVPQVAEELEFALIDEIDGLS